MSIISHLQVLKAAGNDKEKWGPVWGEQTAYTALVYTYMRRCADHEAVCGECGCGTQIRVYCNQTTFTETPTIVPITTATSSSSAITMTTTKIKLKSP